MTSPAAAPTTPLGSAAEPVISFNAAQWAIAVDVLMTMGAEVEAQRWQRGHDAAVARLAHDPYEPIEVSLAITTPLFSLREVRRCVAQPAGARLTRLPRRTGRVLPCRGGRVMTGSAKRKGDAAELEVASWIRDQLGYPARRMLGAGRLDDVGDIVGVPNHVIQVANWSDALRAIREKPIQAAIQRDNAGLDYCATFVRLRGGVWRVVLTPQQWGDVVREVLA